MDKQLTILLPNNVPLEMILVEPGYFIMGDEKGYGSTGETYEHIVHITHPFFIGKYPVTQVQWQAVMGYNPSGFPGAQRPVEGVSWKDIVEGKQDDDSNPAFLTMVNIQLAKERPDLAANYKLRLPTEAEWEYVAKGDPRYVLADLKSGKPDSLYSTYAGGDRLATCGWYRRNNGTDTRPVGLKAPNELGVYDMNGNVSEWCNDWYDDEVYKSRKKSMSRNPVGPDNGISRVLRGGDYLDITWSCRSTYRSSVDPTDRYNGFGFRLVLSRT